MSEIVSKEQTRADLLAAAALLEPEGAWCREANARDASGRDDEMFHALRMAGFAYVVDFNDALGRTQAEVVAALRAAAARIGSDE